MEPKKPWDDPGTERATLTNPYDTSANLNERARSYLAVNCSVCHRFGGGGTALFDVRKELPPAKMNLIDAKPNLGSFGLDDARLICPGDPTRSVLLYRTAKLGRGRIPRIGSEVVDHRGLQLLIAWIRSLAPDKDPAASVGAMQSSDSGTIDRLLTSPSGAMAVVCALQSPNLSGGAFNAMTSKGLASKDAAIHDLFRAFDPNEQAHPKLGPNVNVARLLALRGDAARGRQVFFGAGTASAGLCARCHKVNGEGADFGPDLSHISIKYNRADLLDNILNPSKTIAPGYATTLVRTKSGDTFSGIAVTRDNQQVVLKTPDLKQVRIAASDIDRVVTQSISAMPDGLLADLEPQQAADLLAFVASLK
jgi:putative heme-binding domain-containing protein